MLTAHASSAWRCGNGAVLASAAYTRHPLSAARYLSPLFSVALLSASNIMPHPLYAAIAQCGGGIGEQAASSSFL